VSRTTDVREVVRGAVAEGTAELREQVTSLEERVADLDAEREARRASRPRTRARRPVGKAVGRRRRPAEGFGNARDFLDPI
jgi:phage shock protein A